MKYRNCLIVCLLLLSIIVSCEPYEDYEVDTIGFKTVYFPFSELQRSAVSGEGLEIKVGAYVGGVRENKENVEVRFEIDETLLDGTSYTLLPADYYTLGNDNTITIPQGEYLGLLDVQFDSLSMANDMLLKGFNYALPFRIVDTSVDSILETKEQTIIPIKLMNTYEGNFYQLGSIKEFFTVSKVLDTAYVYGDGLDRTSELVRELSSIMMDTVKVKGIGNRLTAPGGEEYSFKLKVNTEDNSVTIISDPDSPLQVEENGFSLWDPIKRVFTLKYKFVEGGKDFEVEEKLTFRNRIRDGINEWRWEGFPGN